LFIENKEIFNGYKKNLIFSGLYYHKNIYKPNFIPTTMSLYDINDIKNIRKKIGLTQSELANKASVSQSLIAKVESNKLDPTYSNVVKIFAALDLLQKKDSLKAKDFIHSGVIACQESDLIRTVIIKMKKHEISQLPVMKEQAVVGAVSETRMIEKLLTNPKYELKVIDVMGEVPPIVSPNTEESIISSLLRFFPMVVVQNKGKIKGIITRSDILRRVYA